MPCVNNSELYGEVDFLKDKVTKLQKSLVQKTVNDNAANTVADLSGKVELSFPFLKDKFKLTRKTVRLKNTYMINI